MARERLLAHTQAVIAAFAIVGQVTSGETTARIGASIVIAGFALLAYLRPTRPRGGSS